MSDMYSVKIVKLNNSNYSNWKFRMELLLLKKNLWKKVILGDRPAPIPTSADNPTPTNAKQIEDWEEADDQARGSIGLTVEDDQLVHIRNKKSAKEVWKALKDYHEKNTLTNKVHLMRMICSLKLEAAGNAVEHINRMQELFTKLGDIGEDKLSETWSVAFLLSSLPEEYDSLITALETRKEEELTFALVQQKVIADYERRIHGEKASNDTILQVVSKSSGRCFFCKKQGHQKQNCSKYKEWIVKHPYKKSSNRTSDAGKPSNDKVKQMEEVSRNPSNDQVKLVDEKSIESEYRTDFLFTVGNISKDEWMIDSGATRHASNDINFFISLDNTYKSQVEVANGEFVNVEGIGTGVLSFVDKKGTVRSAMTKDVLYAPKLVGNVLSVSRLTKMGFMVEFSESVCSIKQNGETIGVGDSKDNTYCLRRSHQVKALMEHKDNCIHHWHKKLGHRDPEAIRKMHSNGMAGGLVIAECGIKETCDVCMKGKLTRLPFPKKSLSKSTATLDLIHSDVCSLPVVTSGGKKSIVTFIDDYSRFTVICLIRLKSEVEIKLKEFVEFVKTKFDRKPKIVRFDRGGEYIGKAVENFLNSQGTQIQLTAGYSPEQNGVAERKNRTLVEMGRCLLIEAKLPKTFWGEAIATANYIQNRVVTRVTNTTPYQLWNDSKPDLNHLEIFGSKCFVYVPKVKRDKLDNTGKEMIFVGYDGNSKAFRCYDATARKVIVSRDVKFTNVLSTTLHQEYHHEEKDNEVIIDLGASSDDTAENQSINVNPIQPTEVIIPTVSLNQLRVSQRSTKGQKPNRFIDEIRVTKEIMEPASYNEAILSEQKEFWLEAMMDEMESLKDNRTFELCELPDERKAIGCKWVYKIKRNCDGEIKRYKARLVGQGFSQQHGVDYDEVFAPVVRQTTFRVILSIAAKNNFSVYHLDVKTAFLYGELAESIYMKQPTGFSDGSAKVWLLKKSIYGLKQAARVWNQAIHKVFIDGGFEANKEDPCLYMKRMDDGHWCYILIYVDDMAVACKPEDMSYVEQILSAHFEIENLGPIKEFLGMKITRDGDGNFEICHSGYIKKIASIFGLENAKSVGTPLSVSYYRNQNEQKECLPDNTDYQKLIGHLLFLAINSRPDIAASISILGRRVSSPSQDDWTQLKNVVRYLMGSVNMKLKLSDVQGEKKNLVGYADADFAEDRDSRKSNSGQVFFLNGGAISWSCRKQTVVTLSSTEAEFVALSDACRETLWIRRLLKNMRESMEQPTVIYEDNQSCLEYIKKEKFSLRMKHVDTDAHFVKDYVDKRIVKCAWVPTDEMIADLFTKPLSLGKHTKFRSLIGLQD